MNACLITLHMSERQTGRKKLLKIANIIGFTITHIVWHQHIFHSLDRSRPLSTSHTLLLPPIMQSMTLTGRHAHARAHALLTDSWHVHTPPVSSTPSRICSNGKFSLSIKHSRPIKGVRVLLLVCLWQNLFHLVFASGYNALRNSDVKHGGHNGR